MRNRILTFIPSMNLKSIVIFLVLFAFVLTKSLGQNLCATPSPNEVQYQQLKTVLFNQKSQSARITNGIIYWVPVKINILRKSDGSSDDGKAVNLGHVNSAIAYTNRKFISSGIQFFIYGLGNESDYEIRNNSLYNTIISSTNGESTLCDSRDNPKTLNLYIVPRIIDNVGGYAYLPTEDGLKQTRIIINTTSSIENNPTFFNYTICHELAHSFFLLHTFEKKYWQFRW